MNREISLIYRKVFRILRSRYQLIPFFVKFWGLSMLAKRRRQALFRQGVAIPPYMIASITKHCNLACKGCYSRTKDGHQAPSTDLPTTRWGELFQEADRLGLSFVIIAGGEPLTRPDVIEQAAFVKRIVFLVFTNGTLLNTVNSELLASNTNLIPVISLEGDRTVTDARRGPGIYDQVLSSVKTLRKRGKSVGASITLTADNYHAVTSPGFVSELMQLGFDLVFYIEYVPLEPGTDQLVLTQEQRRLISPMIDRYNHEFRAFFVAFPGDEEKFGGCLAAGRGFIHVASDGRLEPCPFAPFSDTTITEASLKQGLQSSSLLSRIREMHHELTETKGGCALWNKKEQLLKRIHT